MTRLQIRRTVAALALAALVPACTPASGVTETSDVIAAEGSSEVASSPSPPPVEDPEGFDEPTSVPVPTQPPSPNPPPSPSPPPSPTALTVDDTHPLAMTWNGIDLRVPSANTELIGFHESNHDGARNLDAIEGPVPTVVLESRGRGTGPRTAADIVVDPAVEVLAPVTGTVVRAGTYTLYCDEVDDFAVIAPDGHPGIEVKLLHIDGVRVQAGDRVEAGVTLLASGPTLLPFASQVDDVSGPDNWPHVHLEVVDTSIPNKPNPNSGSDDC